MSPYLTSPRKKHTRTVMTSAGMHETTKTLPPLDINRTVLHHHSTRRSARKGSRGHTVPVLFAATSSAKSSLGGSSKRSHSAASNPDGGVGEDAPVQIPDTPTPHRGTRSHYYRGLTASPEKMARRGQILNKIETIRILRARPAFYPMKSSKDLVASATASGAATSASNDPFDLPSNILGKHITLRMDRGEMKKKKRVLPPPNHFT